MVVKKQLKKISKKIFILGLATSIIFTSCFSTKKLEVKAASIAATLSAWTLYDICLYVGGIALSALGIGAVYENRDDIAEFGKGVVDNMSSLPDGYMFGSYIDNVSLIYGSECLSAIQEKTWDFIKEGGLTPSTMSDLTGDGYVDISDKDFELANTNFWTTSNGAEYIYGQVKKIYDNYLDRTEENYLASVYGYSQEIYFNGSPIVNSAGTHHGYAYVNGYQWYFENNYPLAILRYISKSGDPSTVRYYVYSKNIDVSDNFSCTHNGKTSTYGNYTFGTFCSSCNCVAEADSAYFVINSHLPIFTTNDAMKNYFATGDYTGCINYRKEFYDSSWLDTQAQWMDIMDELTVTLRSLQDVVDIASQVTATALSLTPTADIYEDLVAEVVGTYNPVIDVVIPTPVPWDPSITRPVTSTDLPRDVVTDTDIPMPDSPGTEDDEEQDIDLDGLSSIFSILFYLIMIIIMLIYLFLACLSFIVMIFRIPPSSAMLPEEMAMGFDHLKTIMIPGFNISIYGFAMALIYLLIIFTVIKILRLEINDFKFPRPGKKP